MRIMQQSPPQWLVSQRRLVGPVRAPEATQTAAAPKADTLTLDRPVNGIRFGGKKEDQGALIEAARTGEQEQVQKLLEKPDIDVNYQNQHGVTALTLAAEKGHTEIARMLLEKKANPNLQNQHGVTALTLAAGWGHTEIARMLLEKGADVNHKTNNDDTALTLAAWKGHTEIARMLLEKGADVNHKTNNGKTALMLAEKKGHTEIATLLKAAEEAQKAKAAASARQAMPAESVTTPKKTPPAIPAKPTPSGPLADLFSAIRAGNTDRIHQVLAQEKKGKSRFSLTKKTPLIHQMLEGETPLMAAARSGQVDALRMLVRLGANLNQQGTDGGTALSKAVRAGHLAAARNLLTLGASASPQDFRDFLAHISPGEPSDPEEKGMSALSKAAAKGEVETIRKQIGKRPLPLGAWLDKPDHQGLTPLMQAAKHGKPDVVRLLLDNGANISKRDTKGETALSQAIRHKQKEVIQLLMNRGVHVTPEDFHLLLGAPEPDADDEEWHSLPPSPTRETPSSLYPFLEDLTLDDHPAFTSSASRFDREPVAPNPFAPSAPPMSPGMFKTMADSAPTSVAQRVLSEYFDKNIPLSRAGQSIPDPFNLETAQAVAQQLRGVLHRTPTQVIAGLKRSYANMLPGKPDANPIGCAFWELVSRDLFNTTINNLPGAP